MVELTIQIKVAICFSDPTGCSRDSDCAVGEQCCCGICEEAMFLDPPGKCFFHFHFNFLYIHFFPLNTFVPLTNVRTYLLENKNVKAAEIWMALTPGQVGSDQGETPGLWFRTSPFDSSINSHPDVALALSPAGG